MNPKEISEFDLTNIKEKYGCEVDRDRAIEVISAALQEYTDNKLGFFDGKEQAEEKYINFLIKQGESPDFIINAISFLTTVTFGSKSSVFFNRLSTDKEIYERYRWLFIPEEVVKKRLLSAEEEKEMKPEDSFNRYWREYIRPLGRQASSMPGWYHNCLVLTEKYEGKFSKFFEKHGNDAKKIHDAIVIRISAKSKDKEFLRLGPKLTPLFLQWIGRYGFHELNNLNGFGLPIDLQLSRIAVQTGIVRPLREIYRSDLAYRVFLPLINELCHEMGWEPRLISEALWLIGSEGCTVDQRAVAPYFTCPVQKYCKGVIHKLPNEYVLFGNIDDMGNRFTYWEQPRLL